MFKNWKTTLAGVGYLGCTVASIFCPAAAPVLAKMGAAFIAGGFCVGKDHDVTHSPTPDDEPQNVKEKKRTAPFKTPRMMMLLGACLMFGALISMGFTGMGVNKAPFIYIGSGNPTNFPSGVGSVYFNTTNTAYPVMWVKTTTNGFVKIVNTNSIPTDLSLGTLYVTNAIKFVCPSCDVATNTLTSDNDGTITIRDSEGDLRALQTSRVVATFGEFADSVTMGNGLLINDGLLQIATLANKTNLNTTGTGELQGDTTP